MGAQAKTASSANSMQRVKVYHLNEQGKWDDQGTGHVTVDYLERSEDQLGLIVIDEEDNDTLLVHRISSDEIYRRQEDTIISWRDPDISTELALSFQEAAGCSYIWDNICTVQRNLHFTSLSNESFHAVNNELKDIPPVQMSTLPLILKAVVECGITDQLRVTELISQDQNFFPKLMDLFKMNEDLENMETLHIISKLVKGIILLNSQQIFEKIFADELIMDIIGCLEYDPEVPQVQHHRIFLKEHVVFKEAIPIKDSLVLSKIHQTYRIGYIKDVILPRVLDEATIASLNSIIHANNAVVISLLKDDASFIQELFARMRLPSTSMESKRDMVLFLHEFCSLAKSLQMVQQLRLLRDLASEGIFDIITDVLKSQDRKLVSVGTDILILFLNQDPNLLRSHVIQQEGNALLSLLVKGMMTDFGEGMHCQFLEIMRILVDSYSISGSQRDSIIEIFYEKHLDQLIDVIASSCPPRNSSHADGKSTVSGGTGEYNSTSKAEILSNICELLCFCLHHHTYKIRCHFLKTNAIEKVLCLTRRRERFLVVAAIRFMRTVISRNDEPILRHIVKNNLLKPIFEVFIENGNRYNMLHSGVLDLLEYIRKESQKTLILHIVDSFWDKLKNFVHLGTFQALRTKYEQSLENGDTKTIINVANPRKRTDERALDKEEEDYFNEDSDEEDSASARVPGAGNHNASAVLSNGPNATKPIGPGAVGLVDYEDDEDDEDFNPPCRPESSAADEDNILPDLCKSKHKLSSLDRKDLSFESMKKRRVDQNSREFKAVEVNNTNHIDKTNPPELSPSFDPCAAVLNGKLGEHIEDRECSTEKSNNATSTPDTRQPTPEDNKLTPISTPSPEMNVNNANVSSSEPYSVR
ncbi:serine/threonine-protein phosphatase 4 regulatory subunit 3 [Phalaenopsis equestris]|uniref:serine/threonine-protein phosphatase 4 regulatory subunit 3 n=1 Tax=Phalaenopsis equestris TaxID=78828 RepID=UPI0009E1C2FA|nr:serine/threonine-protein phosphatase 4 regulatory subunit 3 [Phalaenopsis equestris]